MLWIYGFVDGGGREGGHHWGGGEHQKSRQGFVKVFSGSFHCPATPSRSRDFEASLEFKRL
jgi:hypothetical protein